MSGCAAAMAVGEAKIADDDPAVGIEKDVTGFDIAMDDVAIVQFGDGQRDVDQYGDRFVLIEWAGGLDEL